MARPKGEGTELLRCCPPSPPLQRAPPVPRLAVEYAVAPIVLPSPPASFLRVRCRPAAAQGRPKGGPEDKYRLTPVVPRLSELLGIAVSVGQEQQQAGARRCGLAG